MPRPLRTRELPSTSTSSSHPMSSASTRRISSRKGRAHVGRLKGTDDRESLVHEDVVRPVDADVVNLVLAVAQLHNTIDDASWVGGQRSFGRLIRRRSADDRSRPLTVVRRDLADLL